MEEDEKVSEYIRNARNWLRAAELSIEETPSPAAYDALHAMELAAKACLVQETEEEYKIHNIAGEFGKYFREEAGKETCKELNKKLAKYSVIRYPDAKVTGKEAQKILRFAQKFIEECSNILKK